MSSQNEAQAAHKKKLEQARAAKDQIANWNHSEWEQNFKLAMGEGVLNTNPIKQEDPLDKVLLAVCTLLLLAVIISLLGFLLHAATTVVFICCIMYFTSPRRSFPTAASVCEGIDLTDKVAMVTGPTSGIGRETARVLALRGAHVILAGRYTANLEDTKHTLEINIAKQTGKKAQLTCLLLDLNDLATVKAGVDTFLAMKLPLHILVNNAGIMAVTERKATAQGLESQVGVCHIGHFLLTRLLLPVLQDSAPARVVCVSSKAYNFVNWRFMNTPLLETLPYDRWVAYGNAKACNMMFAKELNERYKEKGVHAFSLHPGGIHTKLQSSVDWYTMLKWLLVTPFFFKSIEQGAATSIKCATWPGLESEGGKYFDNCQPTDALELLDKEAPLQATRKLWFASDAIVKQYL